MGLKGNEERVLDNGYAIFSGMKFHTTSYNNDGAPFHLIIALYYESYCIISKKSPPIFINSKKFTQEQHG